MRIRRGAVLLTVTGAVLTMVIGGANATAEPETNRACVDASSFTATAAPGSADTQVSFRVVRCGG